MDEHERFFLSLAPEEEQLLLIRDFLYGGSWDELIGDLRGRQGGKPFVYKLNTRIDEDLERIQRLRDYESQHAIDLGAFLVSSGKYPELETGRSENSARDHDGGRDPG